MGIFNIDFNQFAPSTKPIKPKSPQSGVIPTPSPQIQSNVVRSQPLPVPTPTPPSQPIKQQEDKSLIQRGFELLGKPAEWTQNLLTGGQGYEKILETNPTARKIASYLIPGSNPLTQGFFEKQLETNPAARKATSFAGEMVLDPLNIAPVGKVASLVGKVPKVAKAIETAGKVTKVPGIKNVVDFMGSKFVRGYGLPETYNTAKTDISYKTASGAQKIIEKLQSSFGQPKNWFQNNILRQQGTAEFSQKAIEAFPKFLEPNAYKNKVGKLIEGAGYGTDLKALKDELGGEFDKMLPVLKEAREILDAEIPDLVKRGRMTGEVAKDLLTRGGYFPHTEFAPKRLKDQLLGKFGIKLGERRTYLESRKGAKGFTLNAPKAIAQREMQQLQDNLVQDFLRGVKEQFGVKIGKGAAVPEGYTPVLSGSPRLQEVNGWAFPTNITNDLNTTLSETSKFMRGIDIFNQYWKPTATSMNPAFHFMNIVGNLYNSWLGGMTDPRRIAQAIKGGLSPEEKAIIDRSGVLARGQFGHAALKQTFDNPDLVDPNRVLGAFRQTGNFFENNARSAFFLDQREKFLAKGLSEAEATRQAMSKVNEYLFDYLTGLTPFEQNTMRRIFPFYTWARFNIPLQYKNIITQPGKNAAVAKFNKAWNDGEVPEGDQEGITLSTPFVDENGDAIRYRPNLPVQDIFNMADPVKYVTNSVNPLFKEVPQVAAWAGTKGKVSPMDLFSGNPRTDNDLPFGEQIKDVVGSEATSLLRPARAFTKMEDTDFSPGGIVRQLTGGTYTIPTQKTKLRSVREKLNQNQAIQNRVERINQSNLTQEEKEREINRLLKFIK